MPTDKAAGVQRPTYDQRQMQRLSIHMRDSDSETIAGPTSSNENPSEAQRTGWPMVRVVPETLEAQ
jgi:hypothetical protein